jgi:tetratricopeptide (TPR) repeat protein
MKRIALGLILFSCASAPTPAPKEETAVHEGHSIAGLEEAASSAKAFDNLGTFAWKVSTTSSAAQSYFDQGFRWYWGFNHEEAFRSFAKATSLDPSCAICFWAASLALGPNYNMPMMGRFEVAWATLQRALELKEKASEVERALIDALAVRYKGPEALSMEAQPEYNLKYAQAMKEVAARFPDDAHVLVLTAESLMDTNPWKLYSGDGQPAPGTPEIVAVLESAMAKDPEHPGAHHLYVHAVEASTDPGRATASAEKLRDMIPGAGHLVHMPAHIFQRTGRFQDSAEANRKAVAADLAYAKETKADPVYTSMYTSHNFMFLAFATSMEGKSEECIRAATDGEGWVSPALFASMPWMQFTKGFRAIALMRFGRWDEILAATPPDETNRVATGLHLTALGVAQVAKGKLDDAKATHEKVAKIVAELPADHPSGLNLSKDIVAVGERILAGRLFAAQKKSADAIKALEEAVAIEDKLNYDEPPDWWVPARHYLGAVLLSAKKAKEAEAVYRADLVKHIGNGWSLFGLARSLEAQKKKKEAKEADEQFRKAWSGADVKLTASAF